MTSHVFVTSFVLRFEPGEQRDADARARQRWSRRMSLIRRLCCGVNLKRSSATNARCRKTNRISND